MGLLLGKHAAHMNLVLRRGGAARSVGYYSLVGERLESLGGDMLVFERERISAAGESASR